MNRDPLYQKIVKGLKGRLDGNKFQECAVALLSKAYPNLAPMPGGDDAGMDGAFGTPDGPSPLVCTVRKDVIGNVRKNLTTYLAKRNGPKRAVVATSQVLSNRRKRNLELEAGKLGVTLENIHDGSDFANRLYRDPGWRIELLGIPGDTPALSLLPRNFRSTDVEMLIGRDGDVAWLENTQGDLLLVGHPGMGKTYLHQRLAEMGLCLFAADVSREQLADAIREQEPTIIVVDDAHQYLPLVNDLHRLRSEIGADYSLHLNCWPNHEQAVQTTLGIPPSNVRPLERLRRKEIFRIVEGMGIKGPDWLQHLIIEQAGGKPGLAVALVDSCRARTIRDVWSGEAAAAQLLDDPRLVKTDKERCVLGAFAVGGSAGMSINDVADALSMAPIEVRRIVTDLGSGGLIEEVDRDRLQVRPSALRPILVRDVFYCGARSLDVSLVLGKASSLPSKAEVLMSARQRGASVPHDDLEALAVSVNSADIWEHYASIDGDCAARVLDKHPEKACLAAPGLLANLPTRALHALLDADESNQVENSGAIEHPRRRVSEWVFPFESSPDTTLVRRKTLLDVLEERVQLGKVGGGPTTAWVLAEVLHPSFRTIRPSPASRVEMNLISGIAPDEVLDQIAGLWPRVRQVFEHVPDCSVRSVFDALENWCLPQRLSAQGHPSEKTCDLLRQHAATILAEILRMSRCKRAWRTWASNMAKWGELSIGVETDHVYDTVYGRRHDEENWQEAFERRHAELGVIAKRLSGQGVEPSLAFLEDLRTEATQFREPNPNEHLVTLYGQIAQLAEKPVDWLKALFERNAPHEFLAPFLNRLAIDDPKAEELVLGWLLEKKQYHLLAINSVLRLPIPTDELLDAGLDALNDDTIAQHIWLQDSAVSISVLGRLLAHPNPLVRSKAAVGAWNREPKGEIPSELEEQWRVAVLKVSEDSYDLGEIFEKHPDLAYAWLRSSLPSRDRNRFEAGQGFQDAAGHLSREQRSELLRLFNRENYSDECFSLIMGDETELFTEWLEYHEDEYLRMRPLDRDIGPQWEEMAMMALDVNVSPEELAKHCTPIVWGIRGPVSDHSKERLAAYEALANHRDHRLRPAGEKGLEIAKWYAESSSKLDPLDDEYA